MAERVGRPAQHFHPSWSASPIVGLIKQKDGRWRILATGVRFSEDDERVAVKRFLEWKSQNSPPSNVQIAGEMQPHFEVAPPTTTINDRPTHLHQAVAVAGMGRGMKDFVGVDVKINYPIPEEILWPWLTDMLAKRPELVAMKTGILELANLAHMALPQKSLTLTDIISIYQKHCPSTPHTKKQSLSPLYRLIKHSGAKTLADLTTEKLSDFRQTIENDPALTSAGTKRGMYSQIKTIIGFGLKVGLDSTQIRAALDRAKVLWCPDPIPQVNPRPISPADFHKLLSVANDTWRCWLLVGLNCCLHMEEVCALQWTEFDLVRGTYASIRTKTRRMRIPRAATLWDETITALAALPRKSPFVFTSKHGTRYSKNGRIGDFQDLRDKAGLPGITFDAIRDGSYTAACHGTTDERQARVLAGHKAAGLLDNYVLRNPEIVRPACDAVHKEFFE